MPPTKKVKKVQAPAATPATPTQAVQRTLEELEALNQEVRKARYIAKSVFPYFSRSLNTMTIHMEERAMDGAGNPTFAVDQRMNVYCHPEIIQSWINEAEAVSPSQPCPTCGRTSHHRLAYVSGVFVHEMWHPLRKHFKRADTFDKNLFQPDIWNAAADCEINDDIRQNVKILGTDKVCLPANGCFPDNFNMDEGLLAEEYYELLMKNAKKIKVPAGGRCGSGCDGQKKEYEVGGDPDKDGDQVSQGELDIIGKNVAQDISDYHSKHPGKVPAGLVRWAGEMLAPAKYDWRRELSSIIRFSVSRYVPGSKVSTFSRLSRVSTILDHKVILPTYKKPVPTVSLVFDTSGSMSQKALADAVAEGQSVLKILKCRTTVVDVDVEAHASRVKDLRHANFTGGGGTDMRVGIAKALESRDNPSVIIVFTDGFTPWPAVAPRNTRIIACLVGEAVTHASDVPSFIKVVRVE